MGICPAGVRLGLGVSVRQLSVHLANVVVWTERSAAAFAHDPLGAEFPRIDASLADRIRPLMERSAANIKVLIESET